MVDPIFDEQGKLVQTPLLSFARFIELGMICILQLSIADDALAGNVRRFQFSMTPDQCLALAKDLITAASVIDGERPTSLQ